MVTPITNPPPRGLIVDDDSIARQMLSIALTHEGFTCDTASDGQEAAKYLGEIDYDVLIVDLCMPEMNGHAFSVLALDHPSPPAVIIHTSVSDQRIVRDLYLRGVDDVVCKPTNYPALAVKASALAQRRRDALAELSSEGDDGNGATSTTQALLQETDSDLIPVPDRAVQERPTGLESQLPLSAEVLELHSMAAIDAEADELARCIEKDPALSAEVLKLANRTHSGLNRKISDIEQAIVRLGRKAIGELALAIGVRESSAGSDGVSARSTDEPCSSSPVDREQPRGP